MLERAQAGDAEAFQELTAPYVPELHLHCYRMLGSLHDADDAVQEVLVAAWQGLSRFERRSSVRTWLYRIATNRCLNILRTAQRRPRYAEAPPFSPPEPSARDGVTWLQPYPDELLHAARSTQPGPVARAESREGVELAFIEALQRLPPRQVAVLVLCDVLAFTMAETAAMLSTTTTAVKGALQRARATLSRSPSPAHPEKEARSHGERRLARRFAEAFTRDDIEGILSLLTDDAWLQMPPAPHRYTSGSAIADFLTASSRWRTGRELSVVATSANTQPAFACYLADQGGSPVSIGMIVLTIRSDGICGISRFLDPTLVQRFVEPKRTPSQR